MRRRIVVMLAVTGLLTLGGGTLTALTASAKAVFSEEDPTGFVFPCGTTSFTVQSGLIKIVENDTLAANGNTAFTVTAHTDHVVMLGEDGNTYFERGALWFGGSFNANTDLSQFTFTGKIQIVAETGGTGGTINMTFHLSPNGTVKDFNFGDCSFPA
jgi:hypothetical protein